MHRIVTIARVDRLTAVRRNVSGEVVSCLYL